MGCTPNQVNRQHQDVSHLESNTSNRQVYTTDSNNLMYVNIKKAQVYKSKVDQDNDDKVEGNKIRRASTRNSYLQVNSPNKVPKVKNSYSLR